MSGSSITTADLFALDKGGELLDEVSSDAPDHRRLDAMIREKAIPLDQCDSDGRNPVSWAALKGYADHLMTMIAREVNLNWTDRGGVTPMMLAAGAGHRDAVEILVESGADMGLKDKQGRTAAMHAMAAGHGDITKYLVASGATPPPCDVSVELKQPVKVMSRALRLKSGPVFG